MVRSLLLITVWLLKATTTTSTISTSSIADLCNVAPNQTKPNITAHGATKNDGIYHASIGQSVNITCTVTSSTYRADQLVMTLGDTVINDVTQIDDVSIRVSVTGTRRETNFYRCCVNTCPPIFCYRPVAGLTLKFQYRDVSVKNFSCVSPDFKYMNCSWLITNTDDQFVWNMTYCIKEYSASRLRCKSNNNYTLSYGTQQTMCQSELASSGSFNKDTVYSCQIGINGNDDFYKHQIYVINVIGISDYTEAKGGGTVHSGIGIVQYSPVEDLDVLGSPSFTNLTLQWSTPVFIYGAETQYKLTVWQLLPRGNVYNGSYSTNKTAYTLTRLTPGSSYNIEVRAKPRKSPYWSNPSDITVTTNQTSQHFGNSSQQKKTAAIVGTSVSLAIVVIVVISCLVYHRKKLQPRMKIPIDVPDISNLPESSEPPIPPLVNDMRQTPITFINSPVGQRLMVRHEAEVSNGGTGVSSDSFRTDISSEISLDCKHYQDTSEESRISPMINQQTATSSKGNNLTCIHDLSTYVTGDRLLDPGAASISSISLSETLDSPHYPPSRIITEQPRSLNTSRQKTSGCTTSEKLTDRESFPGSSCIETQQLKQSNSSSSTTSHQSSNYVTVDSLVSEIPVSSGRSKASDQQVKLTNTTDSCSVKVSSSDTDLHNKETESPGCDNIAPSSSQNIDYVHLGRITDQQRNVTQNDHLTTHGVTSKYMSDISSDITVSSVNEQMAVAGKRGSSSPERTTRKPFSRCVHPEYTKLP